MAGTSAASPAKSDPTAGKEVQQITDTKLLARFAEMAAMIPASDSNGTEDILAQILSAKTWDDLDKPWESSSIDDLLGKTLRLDSIVRRPSSFKSGLGMMLVIKCHDQKTGTEYVKATGAVAIVGQAAWIYATGTTAVLFEWCQSDRPTEDGYYPQHWRIIDAHTPGPNGGSK